MKILEAAGPGGLKKFGRRWHPALRTATVPEYPQASCGCAAQTTLTRGPCLPTLLALEGGARLRKPCVASKIAKTFPGQTVVSAPVEEVLRLGGSCIDHILWYSLEKARQSGNLDMILMGQSFGVAVARAIALRLDEVGMRSRGLVA